MPKIEKISWGKITVDGQKYHQALIVGDQVEERDETKLRQLFDTTHRIGDWEQKRLLSNKPEIVLVANGFNGVLKVEEEFRQAVEKAGVELRMVKTPAVVGEYNLLIKEGKKVNALIHTTC